VSQADREEKRKRWLPTYIISYAFVYDI